MPGGCAFAGAQANLRPPDSGFRVDTSLVLIPVTVTDSRSAIVSGLARESFAVQDNGRTQPISVFYREDAACSVGIVLDTSGSMRTSLNFERAAAHAFLEASNPADDFFFVTVSSQPGALAGPLVDVGEMDNLARGVGAGGSTALFDTLYAALDHARPSPSKRRALLVISDGIDNHSRYSRSELMRALLESGAQVYTIAVAGTRGGAKGIPLEEMQRGLAFMQDLAEKSGGVGIRMGEYGDPAAAAVRLADALRNQYVIGYQPAGDGQPGKWHRIRVKVNRSDAKVYARSGYQSR